VTIPAYSPQARGRGERSFGTWQGPLPQELRPAAITTLQGAKSWGPRQRKEPPSRRATRSDLDWIFTVQTERVWSLAGCTVTIQQHPDVGRYTATGETRSASGKQVPESRGKGGPVETNQAGDLAT